MRNWAQAAVVTVFLLAVPLAPRALAQAPKLDTEPPPPPPANTTDPAPPSAPSAAPAPAPPPGRPTVLRRPDADAEPPKPTFDPVKARKDMEIGSYYLRTGNYDAAIDRLKEAADLQPGVAGPFLLLGKTYEKKHDTKEAIEAYQRYLSLYAKAPDHDAIEKEIEKLNNEIEHQPKKQS